MNRAKWAAKRAAEKAEKAGRRVEEAGAKPPDRPAGPDAAARSKAAYDALLVPLTRTAPDDELLAVAERLFDARMAAAAPEARRTSRTIIHPECFRERVPRGFGE